MAWKVKVGDTIEINDVIVEIETAKSLVELPSPYEGTVLALLVDEGETVPVGTPIISVGAEGERPRPPPRRRPRPSRPSPTPTSAWPRRPVQKDGAAQAAQADLTEMDLSNPAASGSMEGASLVGRIKAERGPMRRARRGSASPSTDAGAQTQMQVQGAFSPGGAQSQDVLPADESPVPAVDQRPAPAAAPAEALVPAAAQRRGRRRTCPGEAAGAQARQGPRRRPVHPHRLRSVGLDHPRRRPRCGDRLGSRRCPSRWSSRPEGRGPYRDLWCTRDPRARSRACAR